MEIGDGQGLARRGTSPTSSVKTPRSMEIGAFNIHLGNVAPYTKKSMEWIGERTEKINICGISGTDWSVCIISCLLQQTHIGGGRDVGEKSLIYPQDEIETCLLHAISLTPEFFGFFCLKIIYLFSLSLELIPSARFFRSILL